MRTVLFVALAVVALVLLSTSIISTESTAIKAVSSASIEPVKAGAEKANRLVADPSQPSVSDHFIPTVLDPFIYRGPAFEPDHSEETTQGTVQNVRAWSVNATYNPPTQVLESVTPAQAAFALGFTYNAPPAL